ncbi:hypothetical protein E5N72_11760 [Pseudoalteromonas sp. MEBiC 03607]|jgi:hypothetical protein|uniref:hypothetical protein n=1 Tax=unclassified Pseudoalteromonas TaxID=194690 RepID=UPI001093ABF0|nr:MULTISPECIES: hypothetical protein [unclassified Pseudoalteromonas]MCO7249246.1 hypothetical protein [Pseudoalteromonas sp. Ps84H-4]TGV20714.1 hypothetical protein E5N72_11760 [Pseudoalteromonas sp. MEBiC 03607]
MLKSLYVLLSISLLSGCTVIGLVADGIGGRSSQAQPATANSAPKENNRVNYGMTMTMIGYEIDKAIVEGLENGSKDKDVELKCRQISRTVKECVEVQAEPKKKPTLMDSFNED